ncbi:hypothetical protein QR680_000299 [Steinernema hermaphroditum]|uniref:Cathepsin propeptide inhibitor domain-containing protein n=1 Tax=Steinernema hermaphroditum TaxID=289476 RepID=A0AA39GU41_9BILA|nr:hypothetical protein QR680_000299 [Steinernema hermaphroditum]
MQHCANYGLIVLVISMLLSTIFASEQEAARSPTLSGSWKTEQQAAALAPREFIKRSNLYALFKKVNYEANRRKLYNEMVKKADADYFY